MSWGLNERSIPPRVVYPLRMYTRTLNREPVTEVGLGCWQIGGGWGRPWDDATAQQIMRAAYDAGVRLFDTADVYGDGDAESERSVGRFLAALSAEQRAGVFVATKLGRNGLYPDGYTRDSLRAATDASRKRLGVDTLDLTQLHCLPHAVLKRGEVFDWLREQRDAGLIAGFGASVESCEEGLTCLEQEGLSSLQVIFNVFRQKPLDELLPRAKAKGVAVIVRLPLASGLLTGKLTRATAFAEGDHRHFNRDGAAFNVGETFAGLPYDKGLELSEAALTHFPAGVPAPQAALRWILDHDAVTVVIPGASSPAQAQSNAAASERAPLGETVHAELAAFYREQVHAHIRGPY